MMDDSEWGNVLTRKQIKTNRKKKGVEESRKQTIDLLKHFKIKFCKKPYRSHDISTCIHAHNESEIRRYPFHSDHKTLKYSKNLCNSMLNDGACHFGDSCLQAHNKYEQHFHPALYQTVLCKRKPCKIFFCYYAHGEKERRKFDPQEVSGAAKDRSIPFNEFVVVPKTDKKPKVEIEIVPRDWTGWRKQIGAEVVMPCPLPDHFSRMIHNNSDIQIKVRDICLMSGCTPYLDVTQTTFMSPVSLILRGQNGNDIDNATNDIKKYMETCRPKSSEEFPARYLYHLEKNYEGTDLLEELISKNKGLDISIDNELGVINIWGSVESKRRLVLLELQKYSNEFSLTDAKAVVEARLRNMELELQKAQQELQKVLKENKNLKKALSSTESAVREQPTPRPKYWVSTDDYQEFKLEKNSIEWELVETKWLATIGSFHSQNEICEITRIENHALWAHYALLKKNISNEKDLWHGTSKESLFKICKESYNRSYAGMNGVAYGDGTYFARDSSYSLRYASRDTFQNRWMILTKVLVGNYEEGKSGMKVPPEGYDSVVDRIYDPSIYVVFKDFQAYPAYIVQFREKNQYLSRRR